MARGRKAAVERIDVIDQVGKRHVIVKYTERLYIASEGERPPPGDAFATEYRLVSGQVVEKTGPDSFRSVDGRLRLKPLQP